MAAPPRRRPLLAKVGRYGVDVAAFDEIVDELEYLSPKFRAAMRLLLDSGRPLIATVSFRGGDFIEEVKRRNDVEIWTTTERIETRCPARSSNGSIVRPMPAV